METYTPGDGFDIPIISYTSGISVQGGIWFCGLRDSKVEPRKWYEKYGIDDYVYYTIRLEEDKPSSKGLRQNIEVILGPNAPVSEIQRTSYPNASL